MAEKLVYIALLIPVLWLLWADYQARKTMNKMGAVLLGHDHALIRVAKKVYGKVPEDLGDSVEHDEGAPSLRIDF